MPTFVKGSTTHRVCLPGSWGAEEKVHAQNTHNLQIIDCFVSILHPSRANSSGVDRGFDAEDDSQDLVKDSRGRFSVVLPELFLGEGERGEGGGELC